MATNVTKKSLQNNTIKFLSILAHPVKGSFNFWLRFNQKTSGLLFSNLTVQQKPSNIITPSLTRICNNYLNESCKHRMR